MIQSETTEALLTLFSIREAKQFIVDFLKSPNLLSINDQTAWLITNFAINNGLTKISGLLLQSGEMLKSIAYHTPTYNQLYSYEQLVYGAYCLLPFGTIGKEKALQMLIEEYNNPNAPDSQADRGERITHDVIDLMMCRLIHEVLADNPREQQRIISQLRPKRYKKDLRYYNRLRSNN